MQGNITETFIIKQSLFDSIKDNDPSVVALKFGRGGTIFFDEEYIEHGVGPIQKHARSRRQSRNSKRGFQLDISYPDKDLVIPKVKRELSYHFAYGVHNPAKRNAPFDFKYMFDSLGSFNTDTRISGIEEIAEALKHNRTIKVIDTISSDRVTKFFDSRDMVIFLAALNQHPCLEKLLLDNTPLGEEGFHLLAEMLRANIPPIKYINIQSSDIVNNPSKLRNLLDAIEQNETLETIYIPYSQGAAEYQVQQSHTRLQGTSTLFSTQAHTNTSFGKPDDCNALIKKIKAIVHSKLTARQNVSRGSNSLPTDIAELQQTVLRQKASIERLTEMIENLQPTTPKVNTMPSHLFKSSNPKPTGNDEYVTTLYSFQGRDAAELSFNKGDRLKVLNRTSKNWWECEHNGVTGCVSTNYIKMEVSTGSTQPTQRGPTNF